MGANTYSIIHAHLNNSLYRQLFEDAVATTDAGLARSLWGIEYISPEDTLKTTLAKVDIEHHEGIEYAILRSYETAFGFLTENPNFKKGEKDSLTQKIISLF